jgi:hypothetical protein
MVPTFLEPRREKFSRGQFKNPERDPILRIENLL